MGRKYVRCLGPREDEHYFMSTGPYNRVCGRCAKVIASIRVSQIEVRVAIRPDRLDNKGGDK